MEALSQLDIQSPDHVSVITRDGKMTVSITKDGATVTVSMPVKQTLNTNPPVPLQQEPELQTYKIRTLIKKEENRARNYPMQRNSRWQSPTTKLTESQVREIKMMLTDKDLMSKFDSYTKGCVEIGKAYNVTGCTIGNIARGISWKHVTI